MRTPARLRQEAETLAGPLPPLLAAAEHLAASVLTGEHGRRRTGQGDQFWQYRPSHAGDEARMIDWRWSARADDALYEAKRDGRNRVRCSIPPQQQETGTVPNLRILK